MEELKLLTTAEVSKALNIKPRTIWTYIKDGKLKARKVGRAWKITPESFKEFLEGKSGNAPAKITEIREVPAKENEMRVNLLDGIITIYYKDPAGLKKGRDQAKCWFV